MKHDNTVSSFNDKIIEKAQFSKVVFLKAVLWGGFWLIVCLSGMSSVGADDAEAYTAMWVFAMITTLFFALPGIRLHLFTHLYVKNRSIYGKTGIIKTSEMSSPINKVENVEVHRTFWGRIFGYGTIIVTTSSGMYRYKYVKHADNFRNVAMNQIQSYSEGQMDIHAHKIAQAIKED